MNQIKSSRPKQLEGAEPPALVRSWRVGRRTVTMVAPRLRSGAVQSVAFEWEPSVPMHLSDDEWDAYRRGRDAALAELAVMLGARVAVVD